MEKRFLIKGMNCGHCVMAVGKELARLNLIKSSVEIGFAKIEFDPSQTSKKDIESAIEKAGFTVIDES